ncbi:unnamed protein product [Rotaria sp. Silwood2]|nr:unnamed protein product [Rotaria sp. Silwood2]CAF3914133.1 unnamed protein product [Rotaria sp. Silwood2]
MMFRLPPPPRFTLPPPPMLSSDDNINRKILFRLTCSSIRQQQHREISNLRLIIISCISFIIIILIFILLFMLIQFYCRRRSLFYKNKSKPQSTYNMKSNNVSMSSSRSYETISTEHMGTYIESIDTSATTFSTDPSNVVTCLYCHQERDYSNASLPPYYHTLEIPPS